jgi:hypothetical protein
MTVCVDVVAGKIVEGPPIVKKFKGQPKINLVRWMRKQGGFMSSQIDLKIDDVH